MIDAGARLEELRRQGLERSTREIAGPQGAHVVLDGRRVLLLCSNNYLGLADDPRVRRAAADAALELGAGAGASRLVSGTMAIHSELEERLAAFEGAEACVLFGSGYLANTGIVAALAGRGEVVCSDELNHASIVDGCRLARAETFVYRHADVEHLAWGLERAGGRASLIVTDGVFSMDGDVAPLREIVALARRHGARVAVDEAHATGAVGPGGRGSVAEAGLEGEVDVVIGTLGKALGAYGAYACCSQELRRYLLNTARPLIFSTALPPPAVAAALAALGALEAEPWRAERLQANARTLRAALAAHGCAVPAASRTQIVPLVVGEPEVAVAACEAALAEGVFAQAIRPPTVPPGTSRLRLAVMAVHSEEELRAAAAVLARAARAAGAAPPAAARAPADVPLPAREAA